MRRAVTILAGLLILCGAPGSGRRVDANAAQTAAAPRLVVILVMDQFRADYADWYGRQWSKGLRQIFDAGAVFSNAAYTYGGTVTCPGHFSIGTGTVPAIHGMTANTWYDRTERRSVACVSDAEARSVPFGGGVGRETHSPRASHALALADELRTQSKRPANIVSVALKPRSAIGLGGHGGPNTIVVWEEDLGTWATSSAFTSEAWPEVDEFVRAHPMTADFGRQWPRLLPADRYLNADDGAGESTPRTFPHWITSPSGKPDNAFVTTWERSPYSDDYLIDLTIHLIDRRRLGQGAGTDFLALSLAALDLVGHEYGPRSHEVQDVLARADAGIGRLIAALDAKVGRRRYTLAFSADHGVAEIPDQLIAKGADAGRIASATVRNAINAAIAPALGAGTYVGSIGEGNVSLTPGTYDRLREVPGAIEAVRQAIAAVPGIARVYTADEAAATTPTDDPVLRAWRLSYVPGRSGDFIVSLKVNWIMRTATGTTHGSPNAHDTRVPLVLFGARVRAGRYANAASPVDIAPTLASLAGIRMTQTSGRVLQEAIVR